MADNQSVLPVKKRKQAAFCFFQVFYYLYPAKNRPVFKKRWQAGAGFPHFRRLA
jgi:hypothetical protein